MFIVSRSDFKDCWLHVRLGFRKSYGMIKDFGKPMYAKKIGYDVTVSPPPPPPPRRRTYVRPYVLPTL